jgi:P2 family phage major capsid protein
MENSTRLLFAAYLATIADLNNVENTVSRFSVAPSVQQTMEKLIKESSDYLQLVNIIGVKARSGQKLRVGVKSPIAGRTDTTVKPRTPRYPGSIDPQEYLCSKTNFDTTFDYDLLDAWAEFPEFQTLIRDSIIEQQSLDRLMIGWNGTSIAKQTDIAANPLLQDVNKGWLQQLREGRTAAVMTGGSTAGKVTVGPGGDYANLDALVMDVKSRLLSTRHRNSTALRVHVSSGMMTEKYFPMVNSNQDAENQLASQMLIAQKSIGGSQGIEVPFFPEKSLLITAPSNLSIYYQISGRRRLIKDEPENDRVSNYESSNDGYVVEDLEGAALVENIEFIEA